MSRLESQVADYLAMLAVDRGLADNTLAAYRRDLASYVASVGGDQPGPEDVDRFAGKLAEAGMASATIARKLAVVSGFHRHLVKEGKAATDPTRLLETPSRPDPFPRALGVAEAIALVEAPTTSTVGGRRDRALLEFLYGTGARVSEAVNLTLSSLDLVDRLAIVTGKGDRQRQVPLGGAAVEALGDWLIDRMELSSAAIRPSLSDRDAVFLNLRGKRLSRQSAFRIVRKHAEAIGLDPATVSPHTLRHSAATHMVEAGADLRSVQVMLGHAKISTTQVYTRVSPQHLVEIFLESHPRSK